MPTSAYECGYPISRLAVYVALTVGVAMLGAALGEHAAAATETGRIHLSARPSVAKVAERTRFDFLATRGTGGQRRVVRGALVTFAGARARTDRRGHAVIVHRFAKAGTYRARACKTGLGCDRVTVRALPYVAH
jgi:hypothetical protein